MLSGIKEKTIANLVKWTDMSLSALLVVGAIVIVGIALMPDHEVFKAIVLAYIIFP